jgi:hypothetical protein
MEIVDYSLKSNMDKFPISTRGGKQSRSHDDGNYMVAKVVAAVTGNHFLIAE